MKLFKNLASSSNMINITFLVGILGSIFIMSFFIWQEVHNFNYQKILSENGKARDDNSYKEVNEVNNESGILAIAYYEDNTNSSLILEKVDVKNMEVIEKKVLKLDEGGIGDYGQRDFSDPSQSVQFSPNGEDIFLLQREFPSPADPDMIGSVLYHTTFSNTDKYEELISTMTPSSEYDYSYISSWEYSYEKNSIFLVEKEDIVNTSELGNVYLQYYDLSNGKLVNLKTYKADKELALLGLKDNFIFIKVNPGMVHKIDADTGELIEEIDTLNYENFSTTIDIDTQDIISRAITPIGIAWVQENTSGWKEYTNSELGFYFKYPKDYYIEKYDSDIYLASKLPWPKGGRVFSVKEVQQTLEEFINDYNKSDLLADGTSLATIFEQGNYMIGGVQAFLLKGSTAIGVVDSIIFVTHDGRNYVISFDGNKQEHYSVIESFKFLDVDKDNIFTCTDYDANVGSNDKFVSSVVFYNYGGGGAWDKCINSNTQVEEWTCDEDNKAEMVVYDCSNGCSFGACINNICTDEFRPTAIGSDYHPVYPKYGNLKWLGQIFSSVDCGKERVEKIMGVNGGEFTIGLSIYISKSSPIELRQLIKIIGFSCVDEISEDECNSWQIKRDVPLNDLLKLEPYYEYIIGDDCINCG